MRLSEHFTLHELTRSQIATRIGIDNTPNPSQVKALKLLCTQVLDRVRKRFGPFSPSSGFRCRELNLAIRGSKTSQHMLGEAADFEVPGVSNLELARWIQASPIEFDQLILEYYVRGEPNSGWVHCSVSSTGKNRIECLTAVKGVGYLPYLPGLVP